MSAAAIESIEAVVFDLDGVLFDTERLYKRATQVALAELRVEVGEELLDALVGLDDDECDARIASYCAGQASVDEYLGRYRAHRDRFLAEGVPIRSGAVDVVKWLDRRNVPMAIATSASLATAQRYLEGTGLVRRFSAVIGREDVERPKPARDLYFQAAAALGVPARACV